MAFKEIRELKEQRKKKVEDARAIMKKAEDEKRALTSDESTQFDALMDESDALADKVETLQRKAELEMSERTLTDKDRETDPGLKNTEEEARRQAFRAYFLKGERNISIEERSLLAPRDWENRDGQVHQAVSGGMIQLPQEILRELLKTVDSISAVKSLARVLRVNSTQGIGVPTLTQDPTAPEWTAEIGNVTEGTTLKFGGRELRPHQLTKLYKESVLFLQQASIVDVESLLAERVGYIFGQAEENNYINGDGSNKPLGLMVASNFGIDTSRDIVCGTDVTPTMDGLIDQQSHVKAEYWPNSTWLVSRLFRKMVRKLKDGEGRYLWDVSSQSDKPDTLLERPVRISDYMPATFTTGAYVSLYGDFSKYFVCEASFAYVQRLNELFATTGQVGYINRRWIDGMPVLAEAFARGKLA